MSGGAWRRGRRRVEFPLVGRPLWRVCLLRLAGLALLAALVGGAQERALRRQAAEVLYEGMPLVAAVEALGWPVEGLRPDWCPTCRDASGYCLPLGSPGLGVMHLVIRDGRLQAALLHRRTRDGYDASVPVTLGPPRAAPRRGS